VLLYVNYKLIIVSSAITPDQFSWYYWGWFSQYLACPHIPSMPVNDCLMSPTPVSCNVYWLQSRVCTPGVGLLMMIWLELCTSCSCNCQHHLSHSNEVQNGDILVRADPGLSGKMAVETGRESIWLCGCEWSYTVCADWSPVRFAFADESHENGWLTRALVTSRLKHNGESYGEVFII